MRHPHVKYYSTLLRKILVRHMHAISVEASRSTAPDGFGVLAKISGQEFELNVWIHDSEVEQLKSVRHASWNDRASVQIGQSAGRPAFWCSDDSQVSILVGDDDETWDFSAIIPLKTFDQLLAAVTREIGSDRA